MITRFKLYESYNKSIIDYTFIKDRTTIDEIKKVCEDAEDNDVYGVVLKPNNIGTAKAFLENSNIKVISVIDLPNGKSSTNKKINDVMESIVNGADEIDLVFNYSKLKELIILTDNKYDDLYQSLSDEIQKISSICHKDGVLLKVIIEIEELNYEQIKIACEICDNSSVDFVQTSTGYSKKKPNWSEKIEKIKFMRRILSNYINIKVSGGVRTQSQIDELKQIGVNRIGTSIFI
jgi:deoxyribose-phosphate aldolase